jgi:serine/threonine protein kinase
MDERLNSKTLFENEIISSVNIGTPYYIPPELLDVSFKRKGCRKAIDIWSFGLIIYELFT